MAADLKLSQLIQRTPDGTEFFEVIISPFTTGTNRKVLISDLVALLGGGGTWGSITGTLSNQTDLNTALGLLAPIASPGLTGNPTAPTAAPGDNDISIATTAFVQQEILSDTLITYRRETASYTLDATDLANINAGKTLLLEMNVGAANNLTVPPNATQAFAIGTRIKVKQYGAGQTSLVAGAGVDLRASAGVLTIGSQYGTAILEKVATNEWYLENGDPSVLSSTWTPTLTNTTNIAASTAYLCSYSRVGNRVTVSGRVDIDPTSTGNTVLGISLPIASAFSTANQAGGVAFSPGIAGQGAAILSDATNDRLTLQYVAVDVTNQSFYFTGGYELI